MEFTIEVHSWIGENLVRYLKGIGAHIDSHAVDPGGDGKDYIYGSIRGGWTKKELEERIANCDIPKAMFKIS